MKPTPFNAMFMGMLISSGFRMYVMDSMGLEAYLIWCEENWIGMSPVIGLVFMLFGILGIIRIDTQYRVAKQRMERKL